MCFSRTGRTQSAGPPAALAFTLLLGLSLASGPAEATTVRGLSLYEKTQVAQSIVRAQVVSVDVSWEREGHSAQTLVTLRVEENLKGPLEVGSKFELRQSGGKIGDFVHDIPGMSPFTAGEEVILFLEPFERYQVEIGIGIGKYGIQKQDSGARYVTHDPNVALVYTKADGSMRIEEAQPMTPERLEKFIARVRNYVTGALKPSAPASEPPKLRPTLTPKPIPAKN